MITANEPAAKQPRLHAEGSPSPTVITTSTAYSPSPNPVSEGMTPNPFSGNTSVVWTTSVGSPLEVPVDLTALKTKDIFPTRKQREFIPDSKKDESYWDRRRRNNEAAKRSREKRRLNDMVLETRMMELTKENALLRAELVTLRDKFSLPPQPLMNPEQVTLHLSCPPIDVRNRRNKLLTSLMPTVPPVVTMPGLVSSEPATTPALSSSPAMATTSPLHSSAISSAHPDHHVIPPHIQVPSPVVAVHWGHEEYKENGLIKECPIQQPIAHPTHHPHPVIQQHLSGSVEFVNTVEPESPSRTSPVDECGVSTCSWSSGDEPAQVNAHHHYCLPHKLRHKTLLGDKDPYTPTSYSDSGRSSAREDTSSDGDSSSGHGGGKESPIHVDHDMEEPQVRKMARTNRRSSHKTAPRVDLQAENLQLRSELQRLATEVAGLKDMLLCNRNSPFQVTNNGATTPPNSNRTSPVAEQEQQHMTTISQA